MSSSLCMPLWLTETFLPLRSLFPSCPLNWAVLVTCFYQWMQKNWHYGACLIERMNIQMTHHPNTDDKRTLTHNWSRKPTTTSAAFGPERLGLRKWLSVLLSLCSSFHPIIKQRKPNTFPKPITQDASLLVSTPPPGSLSQQPMQLEHTYCLSFFSTVKLSHSLPPPRVCQTQWW